MDTLHLGTIIKETGDVGRFQILILIFLECCLLSHAWSILFMAFGAAVPDFYCCSDINGTLDFGNATDHCLQADGTKCGDWTFAPNMRTIVSEFALVCDRKWFRQTITTVQMSGMLIGSFVWGHICDAIGRRYTFFLGFGIVSITNFISIFSVNWQMLATMRFATGFGLSGVNASSVFFEFIRNKWRMWFSIIPGWSVFAGLLALFCSNVADWRYILVGACIWAAFPFLGWRLVPESYRWLVARGRLDEAEVVIKRMARINRRPVPDLQKIRLRMEQDRDFIQQQLSGRIYSVLDLLRTWQLFKITALFALMWLSGQFAYYGIAFNVPQLSGNLYMNMFLITVVDLPGPAVTAVLNIWLGRKWSSFGLNGISGVFSLVAGILQTTGGKEFNTITKAFVMASKLTCNAAWYAFAVWTMESFPTVIRQIGKGTVDCISRIGPMVAPQMISLWKAVYRNKQGPVVQSIGSLTNSLSVISLTALADLQVPGLLYFVCGVLLILAAISAVFLEETKDRDLRDILPPKHRKSERRVTELNKL